MAINLNEFFQGKVREFRTQASVIGFQADFLNALRNSLTEISAKIDIELPDIPEDVDENTDIDLADEYRPLLSDAVDYWLIKFGNKRGEMSAIQALEIYDRSARLALTYRDNDTSRDTTDGLVMGILDE